MPAPHISADEARRLGLPVPSRAPADAERMNKTESIYAHELEMQRQAGFVRWWQYQPLKFRLAKRTHYTPDFIVVWTDGRVEAIEIKGFLEDDAAVKFKVAREAYPWISWKMLRRVHGGWIELLQ